MTPPSNERRQRDKSVYIRNINYKRNLSDSVDNQAFERMKNFDEGNTPVERRRNALKWMIDVTETSDESMREILSIKKDRNIDRELAYELMEEEKLRVLNAVGWTYKGNFYSQEYASSHPETSFFISTEDKYVPTDSEDDYELYTDSRGNSSRRKRKELWYFVSYGLNEDSSDGKYSSYTYVTTLEEAIDFINNEFKTFGWDVSFARWEDKYRAWLQEEKRKRSKRRGNKDKISRREAEEAARRIRSRHGSLLKKTVWNQENADKTVHMIRRASDIQTLSDSSKNYFLKIGKKLLKEAKDREKEEMRARRLSDNNIIDLDSDTNGFISAGEQDHIASAPGETPTPSVSEEKESSIDGRQVIAGGIIGSAISSTPTLADKVRVRDISDDEDRDRGHESKGVFTSSESTEDETPDSITDNSEVDVVEQDNKETPVEKEESPSTPIIEEPLSMKEERLRLREEARKRIEERNNPHADSTPAEEEDSSLKDVDTQDSEDGAKERDIRLADNIMSIRHAEEAMALRESSGDDSSSEDVALLIAREEEEKQKVIADRLEKQRLEEEERARLEKLEQERIAEEKRLREESRVSSDNNFREQLSLVNVSFSMGDIVSDEDFQSDIEEIRQREISQVSSVKAKREYDEEESRRNREEDELNSILQELSGENVNDILKSIAPELFDVSRLPISVVSPSDDEESPDFDF